VTSLDGREPAPEGAGAGKAPPLRAPVALFAFNRPELTARVFAAIRAARPSRLFLVCDGPRADRPGEAERCAEVRRILDAVDWPCAVERSFSDVNLGCRARLSSGIGWVFSRTEEAIFLEDDILPEATFFRYCDALLMRYREDDRVMMISGYSGLVPGEAPGASYWFSAHPRIWGWAAWRRSWQGYDVTMSGWPAFRKTSAWASRTRAEKESWGAFFQMVKDGQVDTWDAQATLLAWRTGRLVVIPSTSMVTNIGFGADSTNTRSPAFTGPAAAAMTFPLVHPAEVACDAQLDARWLRREFGEPSSRMRRLFGASSRRLGRLWRRAITWARG
jgi:hypothetical protein